MILKQIESYLVTAHEEILY